MSQSSLDNIFNSYTHGISIFKDKSSLSADFTPDNIPHRTKQIEDTAHMLAPVLRGEKPSNIFIYGKTGTGKSLCIRKVTDSLKEAADNNGGNVKIIYINCKMGKVVDTEYRLLAQIISFFDEEVPFTGLPTNTLYRKLYEKLTETGGSIILVLDEIDALIEKIGDEIIYSITRINQNVPNIKITIVGISNKPTFTDNLDPRIRSSLSEEEMVFPPYNATEIRDILDERVKMAFNKDMVDYGAITKCAALAAQENGDARKALDLLRVAAELCERDSRRRVDETFVNKAQEKLDKDRIMELIRAQPKHSKLVLLAMLKLYKDNSRGVQTGEVYTTYEKMAADNGLKALTQRRVSDLISELDMMGVINASVISKGRYGRTRRINIHLNERIVSLMSKTLGREFPEAFINF